MDDADTLRDMLTNLEDLAETAMKFMERIAEEFREQANSASWQRMMMGRDPFSRMWEQLTQARGFATEHGFPNVARRLVPGVLKDSSLANMIQRAHDEGQAKIRAGADPTTALRESKINHCKAQADLCMEKILEARRARQTLDLELGNRE